MGGGQKCLPPILFSNALKIITLLLLVGTAAAQEPLPRGRELGPKEKPKQILLERGGPIKRV